MFYKNGTGFREITQQLRALVLARETMLKTLHLHGRLQPCVTLISEDLMPSLNSMGTMVNMQIYRQNIHTPKNFRSAKSVCVN